MTLHDSRSDKAIREKEGASPGLNDASIGPGSEGENREELRLNSTCERIDAALKEVLERLSEDPDLNSIAKDQDFESSLNHKTYLLKVAVFSDLPIDTAHVDWRGTRLETITGPLFEVAETLNQERGFDTPEKIAIAFQNEKERVEKQTGLIQNALRADGVEFRNIAPETTDAIFSCIDSIRSGVFNPIEKDLLLPLARYPLVLDALERVHEENNSTFERPKGKTVNEQLQSAEELLGQKLLAESFREIGHGSEGIIYYAKSEKGEELAIKLKHAGAGRVSETIAVTASLSLSAAVVEPLVPLAENHEIAVSRFIDNAPDFENFAITLFDPEGHQESGKASQMIENYLQNTPGASMEALKKITRTTLDELNRAAVPEPNTAKPVNFLVSGIEQGSIKLICIDPR